MVLADLFPDCNHNGLVISLRQATEFLWGFYTRMHDDSFHLRRCENNSHLQRFAIIHCFLYVSGVPFEAL